jgi:preprotein translocase subunit YajC
MPSDLLVTLDPAAAAPMGGLTQTLGAIAIFFVVMYFFTFRPQQKEMKAREAMLSSIAKDDAVVMSSGIHGRVVEVQGDILLLEVAEKTKIRFERSAVARKIAPAAKP